MFLELFATIDYDVDKKGCGSMATLGDRLREARKERGLKQGDLGKVIGESIATISNWERGLNRPGVDKLIRVCQVLNVPPADLLDCYVGDENDVTAISKADRTILHRYRRLDNDGRTMVEAVLNLEYDRCSRRSELTVAEPVAFEPPIPLERTLNCYGQAAAGPSGAWFTNEEPYPVDVELNDASARADYLVEVSGDSMNPDFFDGDLLLVCQTPVIDEGDLGVFAYDGLGYFKMLGKDGRLLSLNKAYPPIVPNEGSSVQCQGRVLGKAKRVNAG